MQIADIPSEEASQSRHRTDGTDLSQQMASICTHPVCLWAALIFVNAIALPYRGLVHDARLYGVQVLHRITNGEFSDDLYLRYGSQDAYSLFSRWCRRLLS